MTDKILFYIDKAFVHFGIAKFIQKHYNCELYVLYDVNYRQKKNFQDQNIVKFKKEWFLQDYVIDQNRDSDLVYLKNFEKKYKINLWNLVYTERLFYKFNNYYKFNLEEILLIIEQECKILESILDKVKPDFLLIRTTDWHRNHLLVKLCNSKNIPVLMLNPTRFGGRATITNDFDKINFNNVLDSDWKNDNEINEFVTKYNKRKDLDAIEIRGLGIPIYKKFIIAFQFFNLLNKKNYKKFYENYGRNPLKVILNESFFSLKKFYRYNFLTRNSTNVIKNEKFVYFPLQVEPERTISISSPFFNNQHEIMK